MRTEQLNIFTFAELTAKAQNVAIEAEQQAQRELYEFNTDDVKTICETIGIKNAEFSWSGFYCQGDGLSFTGEYSYATQALAKIKAFAPRDTELHNIVATLQELQKQHGYKLSAVITRDNGCRYSHENSVTITNNLLEECFKDLMRHFYKFVISDYEYCTSEEIAREYLNTCEFTADRN